MERPRGRRLTRARASSDVSAVRAHVHAVAHADDSGVGEDPSSRYEIQVACPTAIESPRTICTAAGETARQEQVRASALEKSLHRRVYLAPLASRTREKGEIRKAYVSPRGERSCARDPSAPSRGSLRSSGLHADVRSRFSLRVIS